MLNMYVLVILECWLELNLPKTLTRGPRFHLAMCVWKIVGDIQYQRFGMSWNAVKKCQADVLKLSEDEEALYAIINAYLSHVSDCKCNGSVRIPHSSVHAILTGVSIP